MGTESTTDTSVSGQARSGEGVLTFDNQILTSLLVPLASAADLVSKAITFMAEGVAVLTHWITHYLLPLDAQRLAREEEGNTVNLPPRKSPIPNALLAWLLRAPCQAHAQHRRPVAPWIAAASVSGAPCQTH